MNLTCQCDHATSFAIILVSRGYVCTYKTEKDLFCISQHTFTSKSHRLTIVWVIFAGGNFTNLFKIRCQPYKFIGFCVLMLQKCENSENLHLSSEQSHPLLSDTAARRFDRKLIPTPIN